MKKAKNTFVQVFGTPMVFVIFLILAGVLFCYGVSHIGHYEQETHEESIEYKAYTPGMPLGAQITFCPIKAEIGTYTNTMRVESDATYMTDYGYILLTDASGTQITTVMSMEYRYDLNGSFVDGQYTENQELVSNFTALVEQQVQAFNETPGITYYGCLKSNQASKQSLSSDVVYDSLFNEHLVDISDTEDFNTLLELIYEERGMEKDRVTGLEAMDIYTEPVPMSITVVDSTHYVMDGGLYMMIAAVLIVLVFGVAAWERKMGAEDAAQQKKTAVPSAASPVRAQKPATDPKPDAPQLSRLFDPPSNGFEISSDVLKKYTAQQGIKKVVIPAGVKGIGGGAFAHQGFNFTDILLPDGLLVIGGDAFNGCDSLQRITLPDSLVNIGARAFWCCKALETVHIPARVTEIGTAAFAACAKLSSITVDPANPNFVSRDGVLFNKSMTAVLQCPNGLSGEYCIPAGVTTISAQAFYACGRLTEIIIPDSVTEIGEYAFAFCQELTSIHIPAGVVKLGNKAFHRCTKLRRIEIPITLTDIGSEAFAECNAVVVPYDEQAEKLKKQEQENLELRERQLRKLHEQLKTQTADIAPVGQDIATQKGQQMLFDYAAALVPALAECKQGSHRAAKLFADSFGSPEELLSVVSGVLEGTAHILWKNDLKALAETLWVKLPEDALQKAWKAYRFYGEMSMSGEIFDVMTGEIEKALLDRQSSAAAIS